MNNKDPDFYLLEPIEYYKDFLYYRSPPIGFYSVENFSSFMERLTKDRDIIKKEESTWTFRLHTDITYKLIPKTNINELNSVEIILSGRLYERDIVTSILKRQELRELEKQHL